jgi:phospholipase C
MAIEGLRGDAAWLDAHASTWNGQKFLPFHMAEMSYPDPPHERATIETQIGKPKRRGGPPSMDGFVSSYMTRQPAPPNPAVVMGYYTAPQVPIFDFFARNFTVCDHWFASLPVGTQPNRLMAMSGATRIVDNAEMMLPEQDLAYDWLTQRRVRWCVYQSGGYLPFFTLMPSWLSEITSSLALADRNGRGRFRRLKDFAAHWQSAESMPQVIFIEPEYTDGPNSSPDDDHPPTPISEGQQLLRNIYVALISNPARWAKTMMVLTYDEHGGFFDHVPPLKIKANVRTVHGFTTQLPSTGLRVPAFVISPLVEPGSVFSQPLDHTSILQLLGDRFGGGTYSDVISRRQTHFARLSTVLTRASPRPSFDQPPQVFKPATLIGAVDRGAEQLATGATANGKALRLAAKMMTEDHPELMGFGLQQVAAAVTPADAMFA